MKQTWMLLLSFALVVGLLCGCGEMRSDRVTAPDVTAAPETILPDVRDGEVRDTDGYIDDHDTGTTDDTTNGLTNGMPGGTTNGTTNGTHSVNALPPSPTATVHTLFCLMIFTTRLS